jgi:CheY-like chemotaxis protein
MNFLFIDDDLEDIGLYKEAIDYINASEYIADQDKNINCITLTSCEDVINVVLKLTEKPDIIFLDINMPLIGGKECLRMLKDDPQTSGIPVVMLSTTCPLADAEEFKSMGAVECIQKPNSFNKLVKVFSRFIYHAQSQT